MFIHLPRRLKISPSRNAEKKRQNYTVRLEIFTNWALDWECRPPSLCISAPSSLCSATFHPVPFTADMFARHPASLLNACSSVFFSDPVSLSLALIKTEEREREGETCMLVEARKKWSHFLCTFWRQPASIFPGDVKVHSFFRLYTARPEISCTLLYSTYFWPRLPWNGGTVEKDTHVWWLGFYQLKIKSLPAFETLRVSLTILKSL